MKNSWTNFALKDIAAVSTGPFGSMLHSSDYSDNGVPLVNPTNIVGDQIVPDPAKLIDAANTARLTSYVLREGDVVVGRRGEIGRCAVVGREERGWICGTGSFFVRPSAAIDSKFLAHLIRSDFYRNQLSQASTGTTMSSISNSVLSDLVVSIPQVAQQQRIVSILEEAFEGIATAKANAERNVANARALFDSYLADVFTDSKHGWPTKPLGDICEFEGGSQPPKSEFVYSPKAGYVRFLQIRDFGTEKHLTFIAESRKNRLCTSNDLMIGRYGASVGKILTGKAGAYNVALMKATPDAAFVDRTFFYNYLISPAFQQRLMNVASRSAQNGFSKDDIYQFPVPVPRIELQRMAIQKLQPLSQQTDELSNLYERKLASLDALKKSLLHRAFTGQL